MYLGIVVRISCCSAWDCSTQLMAEARSYYCQENLKRKILRIGLTLICVRLIIEGSLPAFLHSLSGMLQEDLSLALAWEWNAHPGLRPACRCVAGRGRMVGEAYQWPSGPEATKDLIEVIA